MTPKLDFEIQKSDRLLRVFEIIHNYIYANDGLSPQQTLEEIIRILFIKIAAEAARSSSFFITQEELETINSGGQTNLFVNRINDLFQQTKHDFNEVFEPDEKIKLSLNSLGNTIDKLQGLSLTDSSGDAKGLAFQKFLANHEKGESGQFFTPEAVVDFCVNIIAPQPHEKIVDPACGSGGFLFSCLRYLQKNFSATTAETIISQNLFGCDINKSIAKIARMKLLLEANGKINIFCVNSLLESELKNKLLGENAEGFDIVLANPPFGTNGKITNANLLRQYELGFKWANDGTKYQRTKSVLTGQVTEILFIEKSLSLLRENGRMAIILPNGHFENSSLEHLRYFIKQTAKILGVVNLPQETFIPYGTGVKTSILFLEKQTLTASSYTIFFSRINKLGYQGNKNAAPLYRRDANGLAIKNTAGEQILNEDFSAVVSDYQAFKNNELKSVNGSFALPSSKLEGRFNYDFYAPRNRRLITGLKQKNAVRMVDIVEIVKSKSKKLSSPEECVEYVELSDVNALTSEIINSTNYPVYELPSRATYEIKTGDIITSVAGNSVGSKKHATAFVPIECNGFICTNGFRVLRNFQVDSFYLLFYLRSEHFLRQVLMFRTGATIPSISDSDFANLLIYLPEKRKLDEISRQMQTALKLRDISKRAMESLNVEFTLQNF